MRTDVFTDCHANELQFVMGGTTAVYEFDLWKYFKKAFEFLKEYHQEIIRGFKKGWNNF